MDKVEKLLKVIWVLFCCAFLGLASKAVMTWLAGEKGTSTLTIQDGHFNKYPSYYICSILPYAKKVYVNTQFTLEDIQGIPCITDFIAFKMCNSKTCKTLSKEDLPDFFRIDFRSGIIERCLYLDSQKYGDQHWYKVIQKIHLKSNARRTNKPFILLELH